MKKLYLLVIEGIVLLIVIDCPMSINWESTILAVLLFLYSLIDDDFWVVGLVSAGLAALFFLITRFGGIPPWGVLEGLVFFIYLFGVFLPQGDYRAS